LKAPGKPVCLIENFPEAVAVFIHEECDKQRGGESRLAMVSAPEVEEEDFEDEQEILVPSTFADPIDEEDDDESA
jgi:hypothetical protein